MLTLLVVSNQYISAYSTYRTHVPVLPAWHGDCLDTQKELHQCVQYIQDPSALRAHVTAMYKSNVNVDLPRSEMDANVIHEYHRHKVRTPCFSVVIGRWVEGGKAAESEDGMDHYTYRVNAAAPQSHILQDNTLCANEFLVKRSPL